MSTVFADRVLETTTTTGTGSYTVNGPVAGYQSFEDGVGSGNECSYFVTDGTDWEAAYGVLSVAPDVLTRAIILGSSNAGAAVDWGAGEKQIFLSLPASFIRPHQLAWLAGNFIHGQEPDTLGSGISMVADRLYLLPIYFPLPVLTLDELFTFVNATGTAANIRMGLYRAVNNSPDSWTLLVDAGTVSVGSTGVKQISPLALKCSPGLHAVGIVGDGTWTNLGTTTSTLKRPAISGQASSYNGGRIACVYKAHTYGALPSTVTGVTQQLTNLPGSGVRIT